MQEDAGQNMLSRYSSERLLLQRSIRNDLQVSTEVDFIVNVYQFDATLARDNVVDTNSNSSRTLASTIKTEIVTFTSNSWTVVKDDGKSLLHLVFQNIKVLLMNQKCTHSILNCV